MKSTISNTNESANKEEIKAKAYELYTVKGLSIDSIFASLPTGAISRRTLFNWKIAEDWDLDRSRNFSRSKNLREAIWNLIDCYVEDAKVKPHSQKTFGIASLIGSILDTYKIGVNEKLESNAGNNKELSNEELRQKIRNMIDAELGGN